jgi:Ni,Fe-hydrogenase maturation factor
MDNHDDTGVDITVVNYLYNEEDSLIDSIKYVFSALQDAERSFEIIVIDDVSMDGRSGSLRSTSETIRNPSVQVGCKSKEIEDLL